VRALVRLSKDPGAPGALREALDQAASDKAPPETLARVLSVAAGAGLPAAGSPAPHPPAPVTAPLVGGSVATKMIAALAIFVAGAVSGGYAVRVRDVRSTAVAAAHGSPTSLDAPPPASLPPIAPLGDVGPELAASAPPAAVRTPSPARHAAVPRIGGRPEPASGAAEVLLDSEPAPSPPRPTSPSTREELVSLRAIRNAVDAERSADALAAIEAHRTKYPGSPFAEELLLLEARARLSERDPGVCDVLDRFVTIHPRSLLLRRVRALRVAGGCDGSPASSRRN
jgi:hypothetical protein